MVLNINLSRCTHITIAPDKAHIAIKKLYFFLFHHKNKCCGYSLEVPHRGTSNEYPQQMFLSRNKKNILWLSDFFTILPLWVLGLARSRIHASQTQTMHPV